MKVTSTGILHGVISDEYGKRGTQFNAHGMPTYSLPYPFRMRLQEQFLMQLY